MAAKDSAAQLALFQSRRGNKRKVGIARFPYRREELGMLKEWGCQAHFPTAAAPLSRAVLHHHSPARSPLMNPHARQPMAAIRLGWILCMS